MADDLSPQPFERRRNLSNRNFEKYGSRRRPSTTSNNSSFDAQSMRQESLDSTSNDLSSTTSRSLQYSYSVNSDTENAFKEKSMRKLRIASTVSVADTNLPNSRDPALLDVKQKVERFETLQSDDSNLFKIGKFHSKSMQNVYSNGAYRVLSFMPNQQQQTLEHNVQFESLPSTLSSPNPSISSTRNSIFNKSIDEEHTEDDVDNFSDYAEEVEVENVETAVELQEQEASEQENGLVIDDSGKVQRSVSVEATNVTIQRHSKQKTPPNIIIDGSKTVGRDFKRNYSLKPRPKTQIVATNNSRLAGKSKSHYDKHPAEEDDEPELRNKCDINVNNILEELIQTEEKYVKELLNGIENYGTIFERKDLPVGLRGKKYDLFGNIEQIAEFHRDEFLPMLHRNRRNLKRLFDEFQVFIEQNCFYGYVIFTMNKQISLKLCDAYRSYFKLIQSELNDKLGINSFLVQPIQRMARYPLLLLEFIKLLIISLKSHILPINYDLHSITKVPEICLKELPNFLGGGQIKMFNFQEMKPILDSCCRLEKRVRTLLTTTNESEIINDIVNCHEFNVRLQGKFRKVSEFRVYDHTLKRAYQSKVFIFDKCIIYTEMKGKNLLFHGRYPCEHVGITSKHKSFTLFYERRKQQECDFTGEPALVELWLELIRDMINSFAKEEREKLHERYSRDNDHLHRKPPSLSLYRDSNRFSSDSGIGNIWVMPKPENDDFVANRTTWYAVT